MYFIPCLHALRGLSPPFRPSARCRGPLCVIVCLTWAQRKVRWQGGKASCKIKFVACHGDGFLLCGDDQPVVESVLPAFFASTLELFFFFFFLFSFFGCSIHPSLPFFAYTTLHTLPPLLYYPPSTLKQNKNVCMCRKTSNGHHNKQSSPDAK
jgi:hypothetical protein